MGPLSFMRVVDATDLRGAMCGRILADLGADVVLVETADTEPATRSTTAYRYRHANKQGHLLRGGVEGDAATLDALLTEADVVIENDSKNDALRARLIPDTLASRHPHLVHVALRDFGSFGPRVSWALEPLPALAASGTMFATGFRAMAPVGLPGFLAHDCASVYGAIGAVAGVLERARNKCGQVVDVSVQEAALAGTNPWSIAIRDYLRVNPNLNAAGTRNADGAYWVLPAGDGWVRAVIGSQRQWEGFLSLLGSPDALMGDEWAMAGFRLMNVDVVRLVAAECLTNRTRAQLFDQARGTGATIGVLHTPGEFVEHEQTRTRGFFADTGFPGVAGLPFATAPYKLSATPTVLRLPAPDGSDSATFAVRQREHIALSTSTDGALLLEGVRVIEFGMAAVVPELCGVLSELGAEVIKVESLAHPDVLRTSTGREINKAFTFNAESRGRTSVAIDITTAEGRELARKLCATADVVAENYRGGVLERAGLGYADLSSDNPGLIYAASQGYGRGGPFAEMPAYGPLNAAFAGLVPLWSDRDAPYPCGTSLNHPDHIAGKLLAVAVLAALTHRARTGEGQLIDMAQTEAAAYLMGEVFLDAARTGDERAECGNESLSAAPHGVYPCAGDDRWIAVAVNDDAAWRGLVRGLGWVDDPSLATVCARIDARSHIDQALATWTATRDADDAAAHLQSHGVSAMKVMGPDDHHADPHLRVREFIVELDHPEVGVEHHVGNPLRMTRTAQRVAAAAPCLGADTHSVLGSVLGLSSEEVDDLIARGICR